MKKNYLWTVQRELIMFSDDGIPREYLQRFLNPYAKSKSRKTDSSTALLAHTYQTETEIYSHLRLHSDASSSSAMSYDRPSLESIYEYSS